MELSRSVRNGTSVWKESLHCVTAINGLIGEANVEGAAFGGKHPVRHILFESRIWEAFGGYLGFGIIGPSVFW